jgi:hypothetical protein
VALSTVAAWPTNGDKHPHRGTQHTETSYEWPESHPASRYDTSLTSAEASAFSPEDARHHVCVFEAFWRRTLNNQTLFSSNFGHGSVNVKKNKGGNTHVHNLLARGTFLRTRKSG